MRKIILYLHLRSSINNICFETKYKLPAIIYNIVTIIYFMLTYGH